MYLIVSNANRVLYYIMQVKLLKVQTKFSLLIIWIWYNIFTFHLMYLVFFKNQINYDINEKLKN